MIQQSSSNKLEIMNNPIYVMDYIRQPFIALALLTGIPMIILGLMCVAAPNLIWRLQKIQNEWRGLTTGDKPKGWDTRWAIYGTVLVIVGVAAMVGGVFYANYIQDTVMKSLR